MDSLKRYVIALVILIAFIAGNLVSSVWQLQATSEAGPQVIDAAINPFGQEFTITVYYPDRKRIYSWHLQEKFHCRHLAINSPGQPPTMGKCD
jgi:hypothetical protein